MSNGVTLEPIFVVPGYTFFYWGFTLPKRFYPEYTKYFKLGEGNLISDLKLIVNSAQYDAKIGLVRIKSPKYPNRDVVRLYYDGEPETLKVLRKLFMYSY